MLNAIEIKGLMKEYPGFRLDGLDLTLPSGSIMGIVRLVQHHADVLPVQGGHRSVILSVNGDGTAIPL